MPLIMEGKLDISYVNLFVGIRAKIWAYYIDKTVEHL
jgi:hypothetical protein